ncbi:hypothetical protein [Aeromonas caviae]|jgi:hypothetical protein|uniref:Uncharacterized protein n=1 Tax=Aeromonas caviae TaxID=648 RepID=A0A6M4NRX5_AERCA|nr:hypothetical protein [Aeromonas caviae]MDH1221130.1 hypothetical protein [Aeromonas caviae]QJR99857.1 Hypothetical protein [Aeromonas caviae]QMV81640.1 Hypothetical protein [Aeromonas caviae]UJQ39225.1 hypothetical protein L1871_22930 [Aeromonas caviae]
MISVCFTPETGTLNVLVCAQNGVPVYIMTGWSDDATPLVQRIASQEETNQVWAPDDLDFAWAHVLGMVKTSLIDPEQGEGLEMGATAVDTMELLKALGEPVLLNFPQALVRDCEVFTRGAHRWRQSEGKAPAGPWVTHLEATLSDYH